LIRQAAEERFGELLDPERRVANGQATLTSRPLLTTLLTGQR
jgi:hypothetical protein